MKQCAGIKGDGTRCERIIAPTDELCYSHDGSRAEERARNASKAAKTKIPAEIRAVKGQLKNIADGVLAKRVNRGDASVAGQLLGTLLRAIELEHKMLDAGRLAERIEEFEELLERQGEYRGLG